LSLLMIKNYPVLPWTWYALPYLLVVPPHRSLDPKHVRTHWVAKNAGVPSVAQLHSVCSFKKIPK